MNLIERLKARWVGPRAPKLRQWPQHGTDIPWFDQPNAADLLDARRDTDRITEAQHAFLLGWLNDGYALVADAVDPSQIDGMLAYIENLWETDEPVHGLDILELRLAETDPPVVHHCDLVKMSRDQKQELKLNSRWRIHGLHWHSPDARAIFDNQIIKDACSLILDVPAEPTFTINFTYGSTQSLHQDSAVFHIHPANYLVGSWLACEDIDPDSGPLVYYPGSHRAPAFAAFDNCPQTNLRTCSKEVTAAYDRFLSESAGMYEPKTYLTQKGEVFLWHGMLIHGGSDVVNPALTRRSSVCHYIPPGMNKADEVAGPFNW